MNPFEYWMPHAHCVLGDPWVIASSCAGNIAVAISYFVIPFLMGRGTLRLWSLLHPQERSIALHGATFIFLCGCTHAMGAWNWFHSNYWAEAGIVALTGIVSVTFAFRLRRFYKQRFS